ncbi:MAG: C_GCAxxG_C_C family protein [Clostridiales bacterium]|nr:C_GCAxxG_C_C family protein [Clostridiales bacterium]
MTKGKLARQYFEQGYNCAQAVACAFAEEMNMSVEQIARLASCFGAGIGRMRETCGAFTGALIVYGYFKGNDVAEDQQAKQATYAAVQRFMIPFTDKFGTLICRDLLGEEGKGPITPTPAPRDEHYKAVRPCPGIVEAAADMMEEFLKNN